MPNYRIECNYSKPIMTIPRPAELKLTIKGIELTKDSIDDLVPKMDVSSSSSSSEDETIDESLLDLINSFKAKAASCLSEADQQSDLNKKSISFDISKNYENLKSNNLEKEKIAVKDIDIENEKVSQISSDWSNETIQETKVVEKKAPLLETKEVTVNPSPIISTRSSTFSSSTSYNKYNNTPQASYNTSQSPYNTSQSPYNTSQSPYNTGYKTKTLPVTPILKAPQTSPVGNTQGVSNYSHGKRQNFPHYKNSNTKHETGNRKFIASKYNKPAEYEKELKRENLSVFIKETPKEFIKESIKETPKEPIKETIKETQKEALKEIPVKQPESNNVINYVKKDKLFNGVPNPYNFSHFETEIIQKPELKPTHEHKKENNLSKINLFENKLSVKDKIKELETKSETNNEGKVRQLKETNNLKTEPVVTHQTLGVKDIGYKTKAVEKIKEPESRFKTNEESKVKKISKLKTESLISDETSSEKDKNSEFKVDSVKTEKLFEFKTPSSPPINELVKKFNDMTINNKISSQPISSHLKSQSTSKIDSLNCEEKIKANNNDIFSPTRAPSVKIDPVVSKFYNPINSPDGIFHFDSPVSGLKTSQTDSNIHFPSQNKGPRHRSAHSQNSCLKTDSTVMESTGRIAKYTEVGVQKRAVDDSTKIFEYKQSGLNIAEGRRNFENFLVDQIRMPRYLFLNLIKGDRFDLRKAREFLVVEKKLTSQVMGKIRLLMRKGGLRETPIVIKNVAEVVATIRPRPIPINLNRDIFKKKDKKQEETPNTRFITQMNKVTWKNINECIADVLKIIPVSDEDMKSFAIITYNKCVSEKLFLNVYISMITAFSTRLLTFDEMNNIKEWKEKGKKPSRTLFMTELLRCCDESIKQNSSFLVDNKNLSENEKEDAYMESNSRKDKVLGSIDTLGKLYRDDLVPIKAFTNIINNVGEFKAEDEIEIFAFTIKQWGPNLITREKFSTLNSALSLIKTINPNCGYRMKVKIEEAVEELKTFDPNNQLKYEIPWSLDPLPVKTRPAENIKAENMLPSYEHENKCEVSAPSLDKFYQKHYRHKITKKEVDVFFDDIDDLFEEIRDYSDSELEKEIKSIIKKRGGNKDSFNVAGIIVLVQRSQMELKQIQRFLKHLTVSQKDIDWLNEVGKAVEDVDPEYLKGARTIVSIVNKNN
ncbi:putative eukaryotic translation initiation factor 4 gamma like protein [Cucumispora dikerogammari]|nr:putative eukaryotic translation initiation factor 4 gamma like protein [Cucumispora dikerogammari]